VGSARTDGVRCNNSEDGGKDEGNEEEESDKWDEEDGEEGQKDEEQRKDEKPTKEEGEKVITKNLFQPPSNKLSNCSAQSVAEILQGCNDSSCKETAALRNFLRDWIYFNHSEEQDNAQWEQDKEREADDVSEADGHGEGSEEGEVGAISARIQKGNFDDIPLANDITKGEIEALIFLQNIQLIFNKQPKTLTRRAASSTFCASVFK